MKAVSMLYNSSPDIVSKIESLEFVEFQMIDLSNCNQYVSINGFDSVCAGVPQGSVQGPLLFLLYMNDLNQAIKFCKVHFFADDTNLLCLSNYQKTEQTSQCWLKASS